MIRFVDRERELQSLAEVWDWAGAQFLVLYGRRRTGKTALLLHFARDKPCIYWMASQSSATYLLRGLSQALWRYANPGAPVEDSFSFPSWETAFRYAADLARDARLLLVVDEFPYAVDADPSLPSLLQGAWDHHLKASRVFYLSTLRSLGIIDRRVPLKPGHRPRRPKGRYYISDPYLRFYFRFIVPYQSDLQQGQVERVWQSIEQQLPAFVGSTVFAELCRTWVQARGARGDLPFHPTQVGSYWDRHRQVDVVAVNEAEQVLLLGEARYTSRPLGRGALAELRDKAAFLTPPGWRANLALFARSGFTAALREQADQEGLFLVDLEQVVTP